MSVFRSRLFWKAFLSLGLGLLVWLPVFYWLTVPLINRLAYEVEETAGRTVLDNVVQMVSQSHRDLESWRQSALEAHQRELKNIVLIVESQARQLEAEVAAGRISRSQARQQFLDKLRQVRYGNNDYIWAADYRSVLVSHPDGERHNHDASDLHDNQGNLIIPPMVEKARQSGEGYFSYWWRRLDTGKEAEKLSYFRHFPSWQLVIGTGVYIDDVEAEVARRKTAMIGDLRKYLHEVKVAGSGYVFVMDGKMNAIVHPDPQQEGSNIGSLIDPGSGKSLGEAFIAAAARPDRTLRYEWIRPGDPEQLKVQKVAWIQHVPEYDWYLGASAYADDLGRSGHFLAQRIVLAFLLGLIITALIALAFIRTVTNPILRLAEVARCHAVGDLTAVSDIRRSDEIGILADAFNAMVARLKGQIAALEERVAQRTREIAEWAVQLEALVSIRTAEARASEAKFRGLVEQSLAGIFVVQDGEFRYVNAGFARIHGYADAKEIIGRVPPKELIVPADRERLVAVSRDLLSGEVAYDEQTFAGRRRDGTLVDIAISVRKVDYEGRPAIIGVALDVTERQQAEAARETALAAAENLSRLKSEFMANVSHELRTPLNAIIGLAHIGQRAGDLAKAQDACGHVLDSGRHLLNLVTDLLDFSYLETGKLQLEPVAFDLYQLIEDVAAASIRLAQAKGIEFRLAISLDRPRYYTGDAIRLAQVLNILLANAVKFTERGSIDFTVAKEGGIIVFRIIDTGIGMTGDEVGRLFRPFEQLDGSPTRRHGGVGLGLALAERLVVLMGGGIRVSSELGAGSTFEVRVPLAETSEPGDFALTAEVIEDEDFSV